MLQGKRVLLGISASIAAYKTAHLVRLFIKEGAEVKVVMTPSAKAFVTPQTLSTLSKNPVNSEFFAEGSENELWTNHVELGLWADYMIIAPASSNTLGKMATAICDNLLLATYLSAKCPVFVAPAMDLDMYQNQATQHNLEILASYGVTIIPAETGELASGLVGQGRMAEPEYIVDFVKNAIVEKLPMYGKNVLINAGPTFEKIDAVRFIGNFSTGKMGVAIAQHAVLLGANVTLVLGPVQLPFDLSGIKVIRVTSAAEMLEATTKHFGAAQYIILSAAVADYRPSTASTQKIKKSAANLTIDLEPTQDILGTVGKLKNPNQILVGFALETNNELEYAQQKLEKKNLDFVVMNSLRDSGAGFGHDTNKISVLSKNNKTVQSDLLPKSEIAALIWKTILH